MRPSPGADAVHCCLWLCRHARGRAKQVIIIAAAAAAAALTATAAITAAVRPVKAGCTHPYERPALAVNSFMACKLVHVCDLSCVVRDTAHPWPGGPALKTGHNLCIMRLCMCACPPVQRVTQLIHELVGLRPAVGSSPVSKHNLDALFVHGTMQVRVRCVHVLTRAVWVRFCGSVHASPERVCAWALSFACVYASCVFVVCMRG